MRLRVIMFVCLVVCSISSAVGYAWRNDWAPLSALVIDADSFGYLAPALSTLSGQGFTHVYARGFIYPAFVLLAVTSMRSLLGIAVLQFTLLLTTMLGIAVLFFRHSPRLNTITGSNLCAAGLAATWVLLMLSYSPPIAYTAAVLPECIYIVLGFVCILLLTWLASAKRANAAFAWVFLLLWANVLVKPNWVAAALLLTVAWALILISTGPQPVSRKVAVVLGSVGLVFSVLYVPEKILAEAYDYRASRLFGAKTLFCNHSNIILSAESETPGTLADQDPEFLASLSALLKEANSGANGWPVLGINGDRCMYSAQVDETIVKHFHGDTEREFSFYVRSFLNGVRAEPGAYASKVLRQLITVAANPFPNSDLSIRAGRLYVPDVLRAFPTTVMLFPDPAVLDGMAGGFLDRYAVRVSQAMRTSLAAIGPFMLILTVLVWVLMLLWPGSQLRYLLLPSMLAGACWLGHVSVVAVAHTFDVGRYAQTCAPFLLLSFLLASNAAFQHFLSRSVSVHARKEGSTGSACSR